MPEALPAPSSRRRGIALVDGETYAPNDDAPPPGRGARPVTSAAKFATGRQPPSNSAGTPDSYRSVSRHFDIEDPYQRPKMRATGPAPNAATARRKRYQSRLSASPEATSLKGADAVQEYMRVPAKTPV